MKKLILVCCLLANMICLQHISAFAYEESLLDKELIRTTLIKKYNKLIRADEDRWRQEFYQLALWLKKRGHLKAAQEAYKVANSFEIKDEILEMYQQGIDYLSANGLVYGAVTLIGFIFFDTDINQKDLDNSMLGRLYIVLSFMTLGESKKASGV